MPTGVVIQAHWNSSRLRGKISKPIGNKLMLEHVIERSLLSDANYVIVASSAGPENDIIQDIVQSYLKFDVSSRGRLKYYKFHGEDGNVLARYYNCAKEYNLNNIVRITSDCPVISTDIINLCVQIHICYSNDYTSFLPIDGLDTEVISFKALKDAYDNASDVYDLEHVTPYIKKNPNLKKMRVEDIKLSVDTYDNLLTIRRILGDVS